MGIHFLPVGTASKPPQARFTIAKPAITNTESGREIPLPDIPQLEACGEPGDSGHSGRAGVAALCLANTSSH